MRGKHGSERRAARDLLRAGRNDRPLNERVETLEYLMEIVMADLDTLNATLDALADDANKVASQHQTLVNELTALQAQVAANQPIDLTGVITKATNIKTTLDAIANAASGATGSGSTTTGAGTGGTATGADAGGTTAPAPTPAPDPGPAPTDGGTAAPADGSAPAPATDPNAPPAA